MSDLSWLNPTPHAIAVYASQPLSPVATHATLATKRLASSLLESPSPEHGLQGSREVAHHSVVPRAGTPPPPISPLGCDSIEIDQAALITAKVKITATIIIGLCVIDIGLSRGC
jgi:hypothetical protein